MCSSFTGRPEHTANTAKPSKKLFAVGLAVRRFITRQKNIVTKFQFVDISGTNLTEHARLKAGLSNEDSNNDDVPCCRKEST